MKTSLKISALALAFAAFTFSAKAQTTTTTTSTITTTSTTSKPILNVSNPDQFTEEIVTKKQEKRKIETEKTNLATEESKSKKSLLSSFCLPTVSNPILSGGVVEYDPDCT